MFHHILTIKQIHPGMDETKTVNDWDIVLAIYVY